MEERAWVPHGGAGPPPDTDDIYLLMDYLYLSCERIAAEVTLIGWEVAMLHAEPIAAQWLEKVPLEQREARRAAAKAEWTRRAEPLWERATAPPTRWRDTTGTSSPDIATSDREDDIIADQEEILADVV